MIVWMHYSMMKRDIAKRENFKKESIMKKKDYEFKIVIADVYGVNNDYVNNRKTTLKEMLIKKYDYQRSQ